MKRQENKPNPGAESLPGAKTSIGAKSNQGIKTLPGAKPYFLINAVLAGIIIIIFLYSGIFSAEKENHPIPSIHEKMYGTPAPSSGMSRAFSEILRGNLESAREYNRDSVFIFLFFLTQLLQRGAVSLMLLKSRIKKKHLLYADVLLSIVLFLYCYKGQIGVVFAVLA